MENAPVSSVFVGRTAELAELRRAAEVTERGESRSVLVRGEAGVGKTRLVEEFVRTLDPGRAVTIAGGCVELGGDAFPFAPFTAALRSLWQRLPDEVDAAGRGQEALLARIVPGLDVPAGTPDRHQDDAPRLFELIARILARLAAQRLLVLIIEDVHWADASTRHLLEYLVRTSCGGRLMIIATYRSDDIHRRHPLRPFLAEMDRLRSVRRIDVPRFDRVEVTRQLDSLLGAPPDPAMLNEIFLRSDGNAFFVEELARLHRERAGMRLDDLRDVLLTRLEALPETSQRIAQVASQSGGLVGYPLLRAVAGLAEDELIEGLRAITLAQILVAEPSGTEYRFRHSLAREAVSDSLVPGERARINRQYAEALEADASLVPAAELTGRLAQHWYAAHDTVKALRMSVVAADTAGSRYAAAEQQQLLERALELWDQVSDDVRATLPAVRLPAGYPPGDPLPVGAGPDRLDLLATAVDAARCSGSLDRALHLTRNALESLSAGPGTRPLHAAWFWVRRSQLVHDLNLGDGWQELQTAEELLRGLPPSSMHATLLTYVANWSARHRPGRESLAIAERAVVCATRVGTEETELRARITRSSLGAESDLAGDSVAELYEVRQRAETLGMADIIGRVNQNLPWVLEGMGRSDEAITTARHGIEVCRALGMADTEAWVRINLALSLFSIGHWPESAAELDRAAAVARSYRTRGTVAGHRAYGLLVRGDVERAAGQVALARELLGSRDVQPQLLISLGHHSMVVSARQGRLDAAREEFLRADADGLTAGPVRYALPMLCAAAAMEADARSSSSAPGERSVRVLDAVRRAAGRLEVVFPVSRAFEALLRAEVRRAEGTDDPERWAATVAAFAPLSRPYELAVALLGEGRALLGRHGRREVAVERLARAYDIASSLGAAPILSDIAALTGDSGAPIRTAVTSPAAPPADDLASFGLTPREAEVLRLVARGYSNRRIADQLYISQKTTSNHVSNILTKLHASSRTEAAAIAHRHGLPVTD
ncbi:helix-turn-helix transcriptional regulator [Plantactinospora sp. WMMB334]|uniref:helix-turn-helix transcriptional regulator n=1 Tax=Plantactinospora sp. WMMB334 TaxID=3404119 RepID=UPI003B948139